MMCARQLHARINLGEGEIILIRILRQPRRLLSSWGVISSSPISHTLLPRVHREKVTGRGAGCWMKGETFEEHSCLALSAKVHPLFIDVQCSISDPMTNYTPLFGSNTWPRSLLNHSWPSLAKTKEVCLNGALGLSRKSERRWSWLYSSLTYLSRWSYLRTAAYGLNSLWFGFIAAVELVNWTNCSILLITYICSIDYLCILNHVQLQNLCETLITRAFVATTSRMSGSIYFCCSWLMDVAFHISKRKRIHHSQSH